MSADGDGCAVIHLDYAFGRRKYMLKIYQYTFMWESKIALRKFVLDVPQGTSNTVFR